MDSVLSFSTLRSRLLLLVALALLPAAAAIVDAGIEQRRLATADAQENAKRLVRLAAKDHAQFINEGRQLLSTLVQVPQVRDAKAGICKDFLSRLVAQDERLANIGVVRPDGQVVCSGVPLKGELKVADRSYFQRAMQTGQFAIGDYQIGRITKLPVIVLAQPAYSAQGRLQSVVFASLNLGRLNRFAAQAALPPGATLTVLDRTHTIVVRNLNPEQWVGKPAPESALLKKLDDAESDGTAAVPGFDGVRRLYAFEHLEGHSGDDAYIIIGIPTETAYAKADRILVRNLAVLVVVSVLMLGMTWAGSEVLILKKSRLLMAAAQRLAAGDLAARTGIGRGRDEISRVGATFDDMATSLESRERESTQHLKRIAQLNRVYSMLSSINGAILRIRERDALLKEACHIAVELGRFPLAWIGLLDADGQTLRPQAMDGPAKEYAEAIRISLDPNRPEGQGPTAVALREGRHFVCNDIENDPHMATWRDKARAAGLGASAAFPLRMAGGVIGTLNLYAAEPGFFDNQEIRLLEELAADTSLGLEYIDKERRLNYLAYHDPLTGLPNASLFADRLGQSMARARHHKRYHAVLVLDIEGFRRSVDALGRHANDHVLKQVARYLLENIREGDTVARLEGDEFGIILVDIARLDDVELVANKLIDGFPRAVAVGDDEIFLRVRAGIAIHPNDGDDTDTLLKGARLALHATRPETGSTLAFYAPALNAAAQERRRIEQALHHAIERQELQLHYQPVVDVTTRAIVGLEALLRWHSRDLGQISPATFIPVAEETGLIVPIGEWVLETACRQAVRWRAAGLRGVRIAVNVSVKQLHQPDFLERVAAIWEATGIGDDPAILALEVTESALMDSIQSSIAVLTALREQGAAIYVDDFGTGYSSLGYLQKLPVDTLKIDQGFVRNLETDPDSASIVRTVIALASGLELNVIAEGVETEGQLALLRELGCGNAQGYLFSKPQAAEAIETLFPKTGRSA
jgi:diguanylate cyclase (GGDEF)-like protein